MKQLPLFMLLYLLFLSQAVAEDQTRIKAFLIIEKNEHGVQILRPQNQMALPSVFLKKETEEIVNGMKSGDGAVVEGHLSYHQMEAEKGKYSPFFVIESLHPVSLRDLSLPYEKAPSAELKLSERGLPYEPLRIPVTTEVASAITMTTAMMLMNSMSTTETEPDGRNDIRKMLFISAGTMATLVFLYDQLSGETKP